MEIGTQARTESCGEDTKAFGNEIGNENRKGKGIE
jgi:hypothetical protein